MVDFIGVGAQKSGTSWVYACLYEHPEICAPIKELHFFSRPRFAKGKEWYEGHFTRCAEGKKVGEYSTSYLYTPETAERIASLYPDTKLIAIVRNPIARAYSQYRNAIKAGEITAAVSFETYTKEETSCLGQGLYMEQINRYRKYFSDEQLLVLVYEDIEKDPLTFIQNIYAHIGVDDSFVPPSLNARINVARAPKAVWIDRLMHTVAEGLRKVGLDKLVYGIRRLKIPDLVRSLNTKEPKKKTTEPDLSAYSSYFTEDVAALGVFLKRDMKREWNL